MTATQPNYLTHWWDDINLNSKRKHNGRFCLILTIIEAIETNACITHSLMWSKKVCIPSYNLNF